MVNGILERLRNRIDVYTKVDSKKEIVSNIVSDNLYVL